MLINGEKIRKELSEGIPQIPLEDLRTLQSDYPYFQAIRFLYLKRVQKEEPLLYPEALERNAIYSGDRKSLFFTGRCSPILDFPLPTKYRIRKE